MDERINGMCELIGEKAQITAYLQGLKDKKQWTVAQWETASGVPKQTISRLLKAQVESPQFRTVAAIVIAAEGSLDELCGIAPQVEIQEKYVNSIESQEVINKGERSITYLKKQVEILQAANRQCRRHNTICHAIIGVFLFLFGVLLSWDLMDPQYGFIHRARPGISPSGGTWYKHILGIISHKMC